MNHAEHLRKSAARKFAADSALYAAAIHAHRSGGISLREIGRLTGMSHETVRRICSKDLNLADELHRANA